MNPLTRAFLVSIGVFVLSSALWAQEFHTKTSEMAAEFKKYGDYFTDFHAAEQDEKGEEFESTDFLQDTAYLAQERALAADYSLAVYRSISSPEDRVKAATILKEQLEYYSWQFQKDAERIAGMLKFLKVPSTIQLGLKMKDDMRVTHDKFQRLAASL